MLFSRCILALSIATLGLFPATIGRQADERPPQMTCEGRMLADASDGRLDEHTLVRAALIAGGENDPKVWAQTEAALAALADELRSSGDLAGSAAEQARAMHRFLHRRILKGGYDPNANNLAELFHNGRFNCITSSTVFIALAAECGWEAAAFELPAHVLVIFDPRGAAVQVETTCPVWLREEPSIGSRNLSAHGAGEGRLASGRLIGATQLLATYYHNGGVARLASQDFAAAIAANRTALELDTDCAAARQNLLAAWNNWALALAAAGEYAAALDKIEAGLAVAPGYEPLLENRVYIQTRRGARPDHFRSARSDSQDHRAPSVDG